MSSKVKFILDAINKTIEENQDAYRRYYHGASSNGSPCIRALQYSFRHCSDNSFDADSLKRFEDGHHSESVYIDRIKKAKFELQHEEDGRQYGFVDLGGWFRGHRDGKFFNLPEFGNPIWEHKSSAKWKKLQKLVDEDESTALKKWNPVYYDQAQLYMGYEGENYHITTAASEGSRQETICLTEFDQEYFEESKKKAEIVIASDKLHPKIGSAMYFECKWCNSKSVCHEGALPRPNCRNCDSIKFDLDGDTKATCLRWSGYDEGGNISLPSEIEGNPKALHEYRECHTYMPDVLGYDTPEPLLEEFKRNGLNYISKAGLKYKKDGVTFINGDIEGALSSMEMYKNQKGKPWEGKAQKVRNAFGGKFENWEKK